MNQYLKTKKPIQFDGKDLITPKIHRAVSNIEYKSLETFIHDRKADPHAQQTKSDRNPQAHPYRPAHFAHGWAAATEFSCDQRRTGPRQPGHRPHRQPEHRDPQA